MILNHTIGKARMLQISRRKLLKCAFGAATAALGVGAYSLVTRQTLTKLDVDGSSVWGAIQPLPFGIADAPAASHGNSFFIFGGYGTNIQDSKNSVLEFNGYDWIIKSPMPTQRWGAAATVYNDKVYVFGGYPNSVAERYQIANDTWTLLGSMPIPIQGQGLMAATLGSRIYIFFRNSTYEYDPENDSYMPRSNAPIARTWATCALVRVRDEDRIYIIGGHDSSRGDGTNANYYYEPSSDRWSAPQPPAPYSAYGVTRDNPVWMNTIYYGYGHKNPDQFFNDMYAYNPTNAEWSRLPTASHKRDGISCAITNGVLYAVGGRNVPTDQFGLTYCEALTL